MPVHHRLRLIVFPMRTNAGLWPDMGLPRFRQELSLRKMAFDHGGAAPSRITMVFMLPSPSVDRLGLHIHTSCTAQSHSPQDFCLRFSSGVAARAARLDIDRPATALVVRDFHPLATVSFSWRTYCPVKSLSVSEKPNVCKASREYSLVSI